MKQRALKKEYSHDVLLLKGFLTIQTEAAAKVIDNPMKMDPIYGHEQA
jgi:hypothetical protein